MTNLLNDDVECEILFFTDNVKEMNAKRSPEDRVACDVRFETAPSFVNDTKKIPKTYELMGQIHYRTLTTQVAHCRKTLFVARNACDVERMPSVLIQEHMAGRTIYEDDVLAYAAFLEYAIKTCWKEPCDELVCALMCKSPSLLIALLFDLVHEGTCVAADFVPRLCWLWACFEAAGSPNHDCYDGCGAALKAFRSRGDEPFKRRKKDQEVSGTNSVYRRDRYELTESDASFLVDVTKQMCACPLQEATVEVMKAERDKHPHDVLSWNPSASTSAPMTRFGKTLLLPLLYSRDPPPVLDFYACPKDPRDLHKLDSTVNVAWLWEMRFGASQKVPRHRLEWARMQKRGLNPRCESLYYVIASYPNLYYILAAHVLGSSRLFDDPRNGSMPDEVLKCLSVEAQSKREAKPDAASYADQILEEVRNVLRNDKNVQDYLNQKETAETSVDDLLRRELRAIVRSCYKRRIFKKGEDLFDLKYFEATCADRSREEDASSIDDILGRAVVGVCALTFGWIGRKISADLTPGTLTDVRPKKTTPKTNPVLAKERVRTILDMFGGFAASARKKQALDEQDS